MTRSPHVLRFAAWAAAAAALAGVWTLYTHPQIAVLVAEQLWACFGG